jgi:hypothetical protein
MEMMSERERYQHGNLLRDLGGYLLDRAAVAVEKLFDVDDAMNVFPED